MMSVGLVISLSRGMRCIAGNNRIGKAMDFGGDHIVKFPDAAHPLSWRKSTGSEPGYAFSLREALALTD